MKYIPIPLFAVLVLWGCKKESIGTGNLVNPDDTSTAPVYNYKPDYSKNLNVVYFVPSGIVEPAEYHRRISEILLDAQDFFGSEMQRNGYGNKPFGLIKDATKKRIKLIVIKGKLGKEAYPYEGGAGAIQAEIQSYRNLNPAEFGGDHYLVILPATTYDANGEPGGVPFYGLGKFCFALDYKDQDIKHLGVGGTLGTRATKWIGGMIHELGHGLNLPHNCQKESEHNTLGMALMWAGNSTWGISKTFLTAADCAVLNVNQVFNNNNNTYYGPVQANIEKIYARYDAGRQAIVVSGKYKSNTTVTDILYYNDPNVNNEGIGVNRDYNAVTWTSKPLSTDSFYVEMLVSDLKYRTSEVYELKVKLACINGTIKETIYTYAFKNGIPTLNFSTRPEKDKTGWTISSYSSQETVNENGAAINVIDGQADSYWHSQWSGNGAVYPHYLVIDIKQKQAAAGIVFIQRQNLNRAVKEVEFLVSDDGVQFTSAISAIIPQSTGPQYIQLPAGLAFRYLKLVAKSSWDGEKFAAIGELGLY